MFLQLYYEELQTLTEVQSTVQRILVHSSPASTLLNTAWSFSLPYLFVISKQIPQGISYHVWYFKIPLSKLGHLKITTIPISYLKKLTIFLETFHQIFNCLINVLNVLKYFIIYARNKSKGTNLLYNQWYKWEGKWLTWCPRMLMNLSTYSPSWVLLLLQELYIY